jgi:flavin-binding protein dodecin
VWVSKLNEFIGSSPHGFEAAARSVVDRANRTLRGIQGIEVLSKSVKVVDDQIREYRVRVRLEFDIAPRAEQHW